MWVWRVTCLGEVSTGWAPTTSEIARMLFFIWHLQQVRMQESYWLSYNWSLVAGMVMGRRISWACGSFLLMVGLRRSRRRRPRLGSGKRPFEKEILSSRSSLQHQARWSTRTVTTSSLLWEAQAPAMGWSHSSSITILTLYLLFPTNWKMRNTSQVHCARGSRGKASHPPRLGGQLGRPCRNQGSWTGHRTTW